MWQRKKIELERRKSSIKILFSIEQIDQFNAVQKPIPTTTNFKSQDIPRYVQQIEESSKFQTFVYEADESILKTLLDPNFRPMTDVEQIPKRQNSPRPQITYENHQPVRSMPLLQPMQHVRYDRASFDPKSDLPEFLPHTTMPTRRRRIDPNLNSSSTVRLTDRGYCHSLLLVR